MSMKKSSFLMMEYYFKYSLVVWIKSLFKKWLQTKIIFVNDWKKPRQKSLFTLEYQLILKCFCWLTGFQKLMAQKEELKVEEEMSLLLFFYLLDSLRFFVKKFSSLQCLLASISYLDLTNYWHSNLTTMKIAIIIDSLFLEERLNVNFISLIELAEMKQINQKKKTVVFQQMKMQISYLAFFQSTKLQQQKKKKKNQKEQFMATFIVLFLLDHEAESVYQSFWFYSTQNQKQLKNQDYSAELAKSSKIAQGNLPLSFPLVLLRFSTPPPPLPFFPLSNFSFYHSYHFPQYSRNYPIGNDCSLRNVPFIEILEGLARFAIIAKQ